MKIPFFPTHTQNARKALEKALRRLRERKPQEHEKERLFDKLLHPFR